jgi:hypothetical protein
MVDVSKETDLLEDEVIRLHRKRPSIPCRVYEKNGEHYLVLGVFINSASRFRAIEAKQNEHGFDPFELERPITWAVVVVKVKPNFEVMAEMPCTIEAEVFRKDFKLP